ncbi:MAG: RagB/SusD family nutrient uptake outer membrane protein [Balneolaceae bacterium]|nr:RagB/SusD family nutrient uptake outer membrane protein [Balneolaceae bacterium]
MKTRKLITSLLLLPLTVLWSCDVLDHNPELNITDDQAFVNRASAEAALTGTYSRLQANNYYGRNYVAIGYLQADNVEWSGSFNFFQQFDANQLTADNSTVSGAWSAIYSTINSANHIIAKVQSVDDPAFSQSEKDRIQGEAYFIRALAYFDLARAWGGVPLILDYTRSPEDGAGIGRSSLQETYARVLADLQLAENLLPDVVNRNRATLHTVYALRARLHLYTEEWEQAAEYSSRVIEHQGYELVQPYSEFIQNKNSIESIFELAYDNANRNGHNGYFLPASLGGRLEWRPTEELISLVRDPETGGNRDVLVGEANGVTFGNLYFRSSTGDDPAYVLRIAELYLIRSEARAHLNDLSGSAEDLNAVRTRAGVAEINPSTQQELLLAIENERRLEFALEGHRWFDLVRTERAGDVLGVTDRNRWVLPIPLSDLNADPDLVQNEGY